MQEIELVLFDIGGVLGTNGWDREQRKAAIARFSLDAEDFEYRHYDAVALWEEGRMTMHEYLDITIFYKPRPFSREEFSDFMFAQSIADPGAIDLARDIARTAGCRMMTLNNEAAELNQHRVDTFGLTPIFEAFLSSCYLGARKPVQEFYRRAFGVAQVDPRRTIYIDDRVQNLLPAQDLGVVTVHWTNVADTTKRLIELGVTVA